MTTLAATELHTESTITKLCLGISDWMKDLRTSVMFLSSTAAVRRVVPYDGDYGGKRVPAVEMLNGT
jgi:hypothetical protein